MRRIQPRWKKVLRDIWTNKARTVLVVMSIAVGILAIGVVSGSQGTVGDVLNSTYLLTNPASGTIMVSDRFDDDLVETITGMRQVEAAEGRIELSLRYKVNPADEWDTLNITVADNFEEDEIAKIWGEAGPWPPPDKELVIERASLDLMGVDIGDSIIIETSGQKEKTMTIAGTAYDLNGPPASITGQPNAYINRDTVEWLDEDTNFNRLLFVVAENKTEIPHIETVGDMIENKFENENIDVFRVEVSTPGEHPVNDVLEPVMLILTGLGGLSLVLSSFLVVNTISAMLAQQTKQIGMMKAIGARQGQIVSLYFVTVFVYGLLALLVAVPLSIVGANQLTLFLLDYFNTTLEQFVFPPEVLAVQIVVGLLVPLVASIFPILNGTRVTVREAISDVGVGKGKFGASLIDRLLGYIKGLSRPMLISIRNTFRRKGRLTLTLLTLTLAGTTFVTIFFVRSSMLGTLDDLLSSFGFDVIVLFEREHRMVEIERTTNQIPGVAAAESWGQATVNRIRDDGRKSDDITLEAPPADTKMYNPTLLQGRWLQPDDTTALVINTDLLDDEPDLQLGDEIVLEMGSREYIWEIVGIVEGTMSGATAYANQTYFSRLTHNVDKAGVLRLSLNEDATETARDFEELFNEAGLDVSLIRTLSDIQAIMESSFNFLISFLLVMAVVLAAVGGLGLSGTMSMNVLERVREIGVMRAIGASDGTVLRLVLVEGLIIGVMSWVLGGLIAMPLSYLVCYQLGVVLLGQPMAFVFSASGLGIWLALAIVLALLSSYFPARNASKVTVREVLAYE